MLNTNVCPGIIIYLSVYQSHFDGLYFFLNRLSLELTVYWFNSGELIISPVGGAVPSKTSVESGFWCWGDNYCFRWGSVWHTNFICHHMTAALSTHTHSPWTCLSSPYNRRNKNTHQGNQERRRWKQYSVQRSVDKFSSIIVTHVLQSNWFISLSTYIQLHISHKLTTRQFPLVRVQTCVPSKETGGSQTGLPQPIPAV